MKNLIFKEFKLSVHPLTYLMMALISLASLSGLGCFYPLCLFGVLYTFLFIGIKKGITNNDLYYTLLLPVRREKIVAARVVSTTILQLIYTVLICVFDFIRQFIPGGIPLKQVGSAQLPVLIAICLICYTVFDLIYMTWFYKDGKQVIYNMLIGTLLIAILSAGLCMIPGNFETFFNMITLGHENANYFVQFGILLFGIGVYILGKFVLIKICTKKLLKLDF